MRTHALTACLLILSSAAWADQPAPNPMMTHYHAYRTALDAGDGAMAEAEAAAALNASFDRDHDGGRTGVLALNLATTRLMNDHVAQAYAPALRASMIATQNPAAGVDPLQARLVLGRAELTPVHEAEGRPLLQAALQEAAARPDLTPEAYLAAQALGLWTLSNHEYDDAIIAWRMAAQFSTSAPEPEYARGEARMSQGVALLMRTIDRAHNRSSFSLRRADFNDSAQALTEAQSLLSRFAYQAGAGPDLTTAQQIYAHVVAWRSLEESMLVNADIQTPEVLRHSAPTESDSCNVWHVISTPKPDFAARAMTFGSVGSVVLRIVVNDSGAVVDQRVAAAVPEDQGFAEAVERVAPQWKVEKTASAPAACAPTHVIFVPINFRFE